MCRKRCRQFKGALSNISGYEVTAKLYSHYISSFFTACLIILATKSMYHLWKREVKTRKSCHSMRIWKDHLFMKMWSQNKQNSHHCSNRKKIIDMLLRLPIESRCKAQTDNRSFNSPWRRYKLYFLQHNKVHTEHLLSCLNPYWIFSSISVSTNITTIQFTPHTFEAKSQIN